MLASKQLFLPDLVTAIGFTKLYSWIIFSYLSNIFHDCLVALSRSHLPRAVSNRSFKLLLHGHSTKAKTWGTTDKLKWHCRVRQRSCTFLGSGTIFADDVAHMFGGLQQLVVTQLRQHCLQVLLMLCSCFAQDNYVINKDTRESRQLVLWVENTISTELRRVKTTVWRLVGASVNPKGNFRTHNDQKDSAMQSLVYQHPWGESDESQKPHQGKNSILHRISCQTSHQSDGRGKRFLTVTLFKAR